MTLSHLLYEIVEKWVNGTNKQKQIEQKLIYLKQQIDKFYLIIEEENEKQPVDLLYEISNIVDGKEGKNIEREITSVDGNHEEIHSFIEDARKKVEEARKKHQEALEAIEKLYEVIEPYKKGEWNKETFMNACFTCNNNNNNN